MKNNFNHLFITRLLAVILGQLALSSASYAVFLDANGHYGIRAETRTAPSMSRSSGLYQAIDQSFRLEGEVRLNDQSSMFLEFRLFDDPRQAYLGDTPQPESCPAKRDEDDNSCYGRHQDTSHPGYAPLAPKVTKAYMRYAFDYCIVEAGRRGRDWGLGILLDSGNDPFDTSMSVFDGISCDINMQKAQNLSFSFGFDKLSETGTFPYDPFTNPTAPQAGSKEKTQEDNYRDDLNNPRTFGATQKADDHDQYFFTLEYDSSKTKAPTDLNYKVGMYFANILSSSDGDIGSATDLKFFDVYYGLSLPSFSFKQELIYQGGKSSDPNFARLGGVIDYYSPYRNEIQAFMTAGVLEWTMSKSGSSVGPEEYKQGDANRHLLFLDYAIAPGSSRGYFSAVDAAGNTIAESNTDVNELARGNDSNKGAKISAAAFHQNYKPALIFFNGRPQSDHLRVDGIFDPTRLMNVSLFGLGYRYEDLASGNFEVKLITGRLSEGMPSAVRNYYLSQPLSYPRPVGFYGKDLGYELDLKYWRTINRQIDLGIAGGYALPGDAWQTLEGETPKGNFLAQSYISVRF
ncbi:MAG: hypothetical protein R3B45_08805 [Bdellovibrionota bacterium]